MVTIIEDDEKFAPLLISALKSYGFDDVKILGSSEEAKSSEIVLSAQTHSFLSKPLRFGALLEKLSLPDQDNGSSLISLGPFELDIIMNILKDEKGQTIKITEKERNILLTLMECAPLMLKREELLEKIWGYGEGINTHTLETHIYRLRQKIEKNASEPEFLKTEKDGYRLDI